MTDASSAVLGCILIDNKSIHGIRDILCPSDFLRSSDRSLYEAMIDLSTTQTPPSVTSVQRGLLCKGWSRRR